MTSVMTTTGPATARATPRAPARPAGKRRRRWVRAVVPFAVALLVVILTGIFHALQTPDPAALTPTDTGSDGGSRLAQLLSAEGIDIAPVTGSPEALGRAYQGDVTLFVPAPALMHPDYLRMLRGLPSNDRVVLVAPSAYTLSSAEIPMNGAGSRWATAAVAPGCELAAARQAGRAAVYHIHYQPSPDDTYLRCYQDALVGVDFGAADVLLVGASDPFRNDRIGEYGNTILATGLLSGHPTVVWLELKRNEPPPDHPTGPDTTGPPSTHDDSGSSGTGNRGDGGDGDGGGGNSQAGDSPPLPVPQQFWAVVVLLAAAAVAIALARGRRLGPPVAEPLPVTVRGLEAVTGRGHLYRRAKARGPALQILRTAALRRLVPALDLGRDPAPSAVADALGERTGRPVEEISAILYGPEPTDDAELLSAVEALDTLMREAFPDIARGESG